MSHPVQEAVELEALFSARAPYPKPLWLRWQGRRYPVETVHLVHERWEGSTRLLLYSVSANGSLMKLRFDPSQARWYLDTIADSNGLPWVGWGRASVP